MLATRPTPSSTASSRRTPSRRRRCWPRPRPWSRSPTSRPPSGRSAAFRSGGTRRARSPAIGPRSSRAGCARSSKPSQASRTTSGADPTRRRSPEPSTPARSWSPRSASCRTSTTRQSRQATPRRPTSSPPRSIPGSRGWPRRGRRSTSSPADRPHSLEQEHQPDHQPRECKGKRGSARNVPDQERENDGAWATRDEQPSAPTRHDPAREQGNAVHRDTDRQGEQTQHFDGEPYPVGPVVTGDADERSNQPTDEKGEPPPRDPTAGSSMQVTQSEGSGKEQQIHEVEDPAVELVELDGRSEREQWLKRILEGWHPEGHRVIPGIGQEVGARERCGEHDGAQSAHDCCKAGPGDPRWAIHWAMHWAVHSRYPLGEFEQVES